jgi:hypothetical protein
VQPLLLQAHGSVEGSRQIEALSLKLSDGKALDAGFAWPVRGMARPLQFARNEADGECVCRHASA